VRHCDAVLQGKSALWSHLTNYQELEECDDTSKPIDPTFLTPGEYNDTCAFVPSYCSTGIEKLNCLHCSNKQWELHAVESVRDIPVLNSQHDMHKTHTGVATSF
jgi:hypothetical protein